MEPKPPTAYPFWSGFRSPIRAAVRNLPELWEKASLAERHELAATILEAVYVDPKAEKVVVAIRPKAPFRAVFEVATARTGSGVEPSKAEPPALTTTGGGQERCLWWRRGRVELPVQKGFRFDVYRFSRWVVFLAA